MKILQLVAENVKRLTAVEIRPTGSTVVIGGANGEGKSSCLDAIAYALGGERLVCEEPLHRGARKGSIEVTLDDGTVVERTFSIGGGSRLKVTPKDGAPVRSPQAFLDELLGRISFDPLAFSRMKPREQRDLLAELVGLDTTDLDQSYAEGFAARTEIGREQRRLEGAITEVPHHEHAPSEPVRVADLVAELSAADAQHAAAEKVHRAAEAHRIDAASAASAIGAAERRIAALEAQIEAERKNVVEADRRRSYALEMAAGFDAEFETLTPALPDRDAIKARIRGAEAANARARDNARRAELAAEIAALKEQYDAATAKLDGIQQAKAQRIADARYPVDGLAVDEQQVFFRDFPLAQASSAEQLRVSVAIGLAMNPTLRVLLVRDGSLLDARSLALVAEMATGADAQVWIERVSEGAECSVVIEDGRVRQAQESAA